MYISYSSLNTFVECPFKFKLKYIDRVPYDKGNIHSAFGLASHATLEKCVPDKKVNIEETFKWEFKRKLKELPYEIKKKIFSDKKLKQLAKEMMDVGPDLILKSIQMLDEKFPGYELISVEQKFVEPITDYEENDYEFKGIIDIIIKHDDVYHIIDWKNTGWGWDFRKKNDKMVTYQLTLYKHFFTLLSEEDLNKVKTHFALIKRTVKKNNIELFEVPVGQKKINNALKVLNNMVYNVDHKRFPKNKSDCKWCEFYHTQWCSAK